MLLNQYDLGLKALFNYRPYTEDEEIVRQILIDRTTYQLFIGANPRVIFDIGANIGAASVLFATSYPNAVVFAFEPDPENFEILVKNTEAYETVKPFNVALGSHTGKRKLFASDDEYNHGGFSFHEAGSDPSKSKEVQVVSIIEFLENEHNPKIDLLKVDTEGCEYEILFALFEKGLLPQYILGECHGKDDWEMFRRLSLSHDIKVNKEIGQRCFPFYAMRRNGNS